MMILVPANRKRTTEENQNNPPVNDRKVPICIWIYEEDREMFRTIPELKNKMSMQGRDFFHNYLKTNGYADIDLARDIEEEHQIQRDSNKRLYIMQIKQDQNLDEILHQAHDNTEDGGLKRFIDDIIIEWAHDNYNRYKNEESISGNAELEPKPAWIKGNMNKLKKKIPSFDRKPTDIRNLIMEITPNKQEQWDEDYLQKYGKYSHRR